jgi:hypothetical protein
VWDRVVRLRIVVRYREIMGPSNRCGGIRIERELEKAFGRANGEGVCLEARIHRPGAVVMMSRK